MSVPVTTCRRCGMATAWGENKVKHSAEQCDAARRLKDWGVRPGATLYTTVDYVSRSGMLRHISVRMLKRNEPLYLSHSVALVLGYPETKERDAVKVDGCGMNMGFHVVYASPRAWERAGRSWCGMDMGFHVVYELGRSLFPRGFNLPKGERGRNGDTSGHDNDGGYALKQRWL